jgi:hypothetical protein
MIDIKNTKPGDFLEFDKVDVGHDWQEKDIRERLAMNQWYEVEYIVVHSWSTAVYLVGFDEPFNSVFFSNVNDNTGFKLKE